MDANTISLAACLLLTIAVCIALEWMNREYKPRVAYDQPRSAKHVRIVHSSFDVKLAYYDHSGRKVTVRIVPLARYAACIRSARAKGYRVV